MRQALADSLTRRVLMGLAMGLTAIAIVYSPWGKRSGAHLNPAVTLTFFRLGKVETPDAIFYVLAQFVGGVAGVLLASALLRSVLGHPAVNYVATLPGETGVVGRVFCRSRHHVSSDADGADGFQSGEAGALTGLFAGTLVAIYITFEAPLSGMSMNPARTFGSAVGGNIWTALWIYFAAPPLGMLLAAEAYLRLAGAHKVFCAKLHHHNDQRCIFRCNFGSLSTRTSVPYPEP